MDADADAVALWHRVVVRVGILVLGFRIIDHIGLLHVTEQAGQRRLVPAQRPQQARVAFRNVDHLLLDPRQLAKRHRRHRRHLHRTNKQATKCQGEQIFN